MTKSLAQYFIFLGNRVTSPYIVTKLIALAMDLYFKGLSLRKIADTFEQFYNLSVHHDAIRVWIDTFMEHITKYVNHYNPDVGELWNLDEQKVKSDGKWVYSWNIMDKELH